MGTDRTTEEKYTLGRTKQLKKVYIGTDKTTEEKYSLGQIKQLEKSLYWTR